MKKATSFVKRNLKDKHYLDDGTLHELLITKVALRSSFTRKQAN